VERKVRHSLKMGGFKKKKKREGRGEGRGRGDGKIRFLKLD